MTSGSWQIGKTGNRDASAAEGRARCVRSAQCETRLARQAQCSGNFLARRFSSVQRIRNTKKT